MNTPEKFKLTVLNTRSCIKSTKFSKTFDSVKLYLTNYDEVTMLFTSLSKTTHRVNITKNVEKIEYDFKNDEKVATVNLISADSPEKDILVKIELNPDIKDLKSRIHRFFHVAKQFRLYSIDKNPKKLSSFPKNFFSKHSYTPTDNLTKSTSKILKSDSELPDFDRIKRKLSFSYSHTPKRDEAPSFKKLAPENGFENKFQMTAKTSNGNNEHPKPPENGILADKTAQNTADCTNIKSVKSSKELLKTSLSGEDSVIKGAGDVAKRGFINQGNSCYINSVMQALLRLDLFRETFLAVCSKDQAYPVCYQIRKIFFLIEKYPSAISLRNLKETISQSNALFSGNFQQDAHEFLVSLFDIVRSEIDQKLKKSPGAAPNPINFCFLSNIKQILCCEKCRLRRESDEQHLHFSLDFGAAQADGDAAAKPKGGARPARSCKDIVRSYAEGLGSAGPCPSHGGVYMSQKVNRATQEVFFSCDFEQCHYKCDAVPPNAKPPKFSVEKMLKSYFSPKHIFLNCSSCGGDAAVASYKVTRLPRVLILHLKRFAVGTLALNGEVETLGIKKLAHSVEIGEKIEFKNVGFSAPEFEGVSYALHALVRHKGMTPDRGHYVTDVFDQKSKTWVEFDDINCRKVDRNSIFNDNEREKSCYMLFYELE